MATILTKKKDTTGAPSAGDLTNSTGGAELAVNTADKRLYTKNSSNAVVEVGTNPGEAVTFVAGSASTPAITTTGDTNTGIFFPAADTIAFAEGGAEAMRINSSAKLLIGTTSSYASGSGLLQMDSSSTPELAMRRDSASSGSVGGVVSFYSSIGITSKIESQNDGANSAGNSRGRLMFFTTPNASTTPTERARIDSSGNFGIGTSSPGEKLHVSGSGDIKAKISTTSTGVNANAALVLDATTEGSWGIQTGNAVSDGLRFYDAQADAERARITSGGYFKVSSTGSLINVNATNHEFRSGTGGNIVIRTQHTAADPYGSYTDFSGATPNNTTNYFEKYDDSTNEKAVLYSNGSWQVRANSYGGISDVKLKQDIVDANSQWDDIKGLRIRKYRFKDEVAADPDYPSHLGVIAQEAEIVSPGLVFESPDFENVLRIREVEKTRVVTEAVVDEDGNEIEPAVTETYTEEEEYTERVATGTVTKGVKYSILYMKAVKALQEAMERIETLEAKVAALEAK